MLIYIVYMGRPKKIQQNSNGIDTLPAMTIVPETPTPTPILDSVPSPVPEPSTESKASKASDTTQSLDNDFMSKFASDYKDQAAIPTIEEVKKKRGPKPGSKRNATPDPQTFVPPPQKPIFVGAVINGAIFITMIDIFVPMIITAIHNKVSKKKIKLQDLKLEKSVKSELEPLCNEVIRSMNIQMNPSVALLLTVITMYSTAWMTAVNKSEKA